MANQSVFGTRQEGGSMEWESVRLTVFRLNGKVGLAVQAGGNTPPVMLAPQDAYTLADELLDQADECRKQSPRDRSLYSEATKAYDEAGVAPFKLSDDGWPEPRDEAVHGPHCPLCNARRRMKRARDGSL